MMFAFWCFKSKTMHFFTIKEYAIPLQDFLLSLMSAVIGIKAKTCLGSKSLMKIIIGGASYRTKSLTQTVSIEHLNSGVQYESWIQLIQNLYSFFKRYIFYNAPFSFFSALVLRHI